MHIIRAYAYNDRHMHMQVSGLQASGSFRKHRQIHGHTYTSRQSTNKQHIKSMANKT